jgi:GNAT superfamily N-acetyltransferase
MTDGIESVTIRTGRRRDMAAVAAMAGELYALLALLDDSDPTFDVAGTQAKLERAGFGPNPLFSSLIAEVDGEPIGYAIYNIGFWADSFMGMVLLSDLFVRDGWRSRGIGAQIMNRLAAIGKERDCGTVMWTVWTKNPAAQRFYERLGAVPMEDELLMEWPI